jgi:hypothetical protein
MSKVWFGEHTCSGDKMARHSSSDFNLELAASITKEDRWKRDLKGRREALMMLVKDTTEFLRYRDSIYS